MPRTQDHNRKESSVQSPSPTPETLLSALFAPGGFAYELSYPAIALDREGTVLHLNALYAELSLETIEKVQNTSIYQYLSPEEVTLLRPLIEKGFQEQTSITFTTRFIRDAGDSVFLEWNGTPLLHEGVIYALLWIGRDVSVSHKSEIEFKHLYSIAQAMNVGQSLSDTLLMVRNALKEVSGFDRTGVWLLQGEDLLGAWGTGLDCAVVDERSRRISFSQLMPDAYSAVIRGEKFGVLPTSEWIQVDGTVIKAEAPLGFAFMVLKVQDEIVGMAFGDNLPSRRNVVQHEVEQLLPLCEQCATAIHTVRLLEERNHFIASRRHLIQTYAEIANAPNFDETLRRVRTAIVQTGLFDRAGVYYVQGDRCHSAWGTDLEGREVDEHGASYDPESFEQTIAYLNLNGGQYCTWDSIPEDNLPPQETHLPHKHGLTALRVGDEILGLVFVDNFITHRPITTSALELLAEFANQVSVAVKNAHLLEEQRQLALRQSRLSQIAALLSTNETAASVEQTITDALVEVCGFDRASCWIWNTETLSMEECANSDVTGFVKEGKAHAVPLKDLSAVGWLSFLKGEADILYTSKYEERYAMPPGKTFNSVERLDMQGVGEHCMVALRVQGEFVGSVAVDNKYSFKPITEADKRTLQAFAQQAAIAIHQKRLRAKYEKQAAQQKLFAEVSHALDTNLPLKYILKKLYDGIREIENIDRVGIWVAPLIGESGYYGWGTSREGATVPFTEVDRAEFTDILKSIPSTSLAYNHCPNYAEEFNSKPNDEMYGVTGHASFPLSSDAEIIGLVCVDNLLTNNPLTIETAEALLPYTKQIENVIRECYKRYQRKREEERSKWLSDIVTATIQGLPLDETMAITYEALKSFGGFDRVGIFVANPVFPRVRGVWGTERDGTRKHIPDIKYSLSEGWIEVSEEYWNDHSYYIYEDHSKVTHIPNPVMEGVRYHALVIMKTHGQIVGSLDMDNPFRDAPITPADVEAILPIAEQAAIAVYNALLQEDQIRNQAHQYRLEELAQKINSRTEASELLLFVREVAMQLGGLERVGIYLVNTREETLQGVWGTTRAGELYDMSDAILSIQQVRETPLASMLFSENAFTFTPNLTQKFNISPSQSMYGVTHHIAIPLKVGSEVLGILVGDNFITDEPIYEENIHLLLPFILQAATAMQSVRLKEERALTLTRQKRLESIAERMTSNTDLREILRMVCDAATEVVGFDRAAVFLYSAREQKLNGVWGTDTNGKREDIRSRQMDKRELTQLGYHTLVLEGKDYTIIEDYPQECSPPPDSSMYGVKHHARIALKVDGSVLGLVNADNLITGRPITYEDIVPLFPFVHEAAIAVRNAQLLAERENDIQIQNRLATLATAINANHDLNDILTMFREALVEVVGFERANIWLYDERRKIWQGHGSTISEEEGLLKSVFSASELEELGLLAVATGTLPYQVASLASPIPEDSITPDNEALVHAGIALRLGEAPLGIVILDNRKSGIPITETSLQKVLPFADQVAVAIQNVRLLEEQWRYIARQRRLGILVASVSANHSLRETLRLAREAVVEGGEFDRAAIFLADIQNDSFYGVWGTDREGNEEDISDDTFAISTHDPIIQGTVHTSIGRYFLVSDYGEIYDLTPEDTMYGVGAHGGVPIEIDNELVGCIFVDNVLTQRPITQEDMLGLLPFAHQVAAAIRNVSLLEERDRYLERQRTLAVLASAISTNVDIKEVFRLAREAVVKGAGFDRAGLYMVDSLTNIMQGTWGTDRQGNECDISYVSCPYLDESRDFSIRYESEHGVYYLEADWQTKLGVTPNEDMYGVHWHGMVPIFSEGRTVAIIFVDNLLTDRVITHDDMLGLLPLASQIAVALRNAELFENLKRAQAALVRSERLSAVGELAGGVAHNVNNILAAVMGYSELIQSLPNIPDKVNHYVQVIERAAKDGADIVRRVQQFARKDKEPKYGVFDLSEIVDGAIELTRPLWQSTSSRLTKPILVSPNLQANVPILGVASEMREVIVNLLRNALDALPNGGTITIQCRTLHGNAVLSVADNGVGMTEEVRVHLFEPFFSTKQIGLGTGLGLSLTWGTIERHKGTIEVRSELGKGAEFIITLPLAQQVESTPTLVETRADLTGLRIVLAEDEAMVAASLKEILEQFGAIVNVFPNAQQTLGYLSVNANITEVLISDQGMPGMTGLELLAEVENHFPHIRRVILSGWGEQLADTIDTSVAERVVSKPIKGNDIAKMIQELLERA